MKIKEIEQVTQVERVAKTSKIRIGVFESRVIEITFLEFVFD